MKTNRAWRWILAVTAMALAVACFPARAQQKPAEKEKPAAAAPVEADAAFLETLADYQMIEREIARIESATGTVEIAVSLAQLRERAQLKMNKMSAWMKERNVGQDWTYDRGLKAFLPPAKAQASGKP